jgi:hypothetical protein
MRWKSAAAAAALIGAAAAVTLLVLAALLWWQHDDRPWPMLAWAAVKGVLWSKTVFKVALAAGLGAVIGIRALARRAASRRRIDGGDDPGTAVSPGP